MKKGTCNIHRRGNEPCPSSALFVVRWHPNGSGGHYVTRDVCGTHLVQSLEEALATQARGFDAVEVLLYLSEDSA